MTELAVIVCLAFDHRAPCAGLRKFKDLIFRCECVETVLEVSGTFDLIVQLKVPSLADYTAHMDAVADRLELFATRIETNFVGKQVDRRRPSSVSLWLPVAGGHKLVASNLIDKVVAQGDYMEVHVGGWSCLLHDTIRHLCEQLDSEQFIQLHRSILVRIDFIERMLHQNRRWIARLRDGTTQRVTKSHVADILRLLANDSPVSGPVSSKLDTVNEKPEPVNEMIMRVQS